MTVTASAIGRALPSHEDDMYIVGHGITTTNVINPGDWVAFSGTGVIASEDADATYKVSGAGIALDRNPATDWAGRSVVNSALLIATRGIFRVSANFSGHPLYGVLAFPDTTGSGVNAASGVTGVGSTWGTATPVALSACTGALAAGVKGVGQVIKAVNFANAGTGELDIKVWSRNADIY